MNTRTLVIKHKKLIMIAIVVMAMILISLFSLHKYQQHQRLQVLINSTLEQLVFVEGSTFLMGDQVYINLRGKKAFIASSRDASPAHDVTLTSYSMQA
ncbi:MAG: hypothetical protein V7765_21020, partial [Oleispira sp.]